ncbi:MAG: hypothetical protein M3Z01_09890 [Thermoproteota archaeon]|nr:hypothetical protein [Thermoproteota archaeon]
MSSAANTHDIKLVTDVVDNIVIKRPISLTKTTVERKRKLKKQHLCIDKAYNSKKVEQGIIKRDYVPHIRYKRKRGEKEEEEKEKQCYKIHPARRWWVVERTNS